MSHERILRLIKRWPNLKVNYRRAALCLVLARDMEERGDFGPRRDRHLVNYGRYLGMAQGVLWVKLDGETIDGQSYTWDYARRLLNYGGDVSIEGFVP